MQPLEFASVNDISRSTQERRERPAELAHSKLCARKFLLIYAAKEVLFRFLFRVLFRSLEYEERVNDNPSCKGKLNGFL